LINLENEYSNVLNIDSFKGIELEKEKLDEPDPLEELINEFSDEEVLDEEDHDFRKNRSDITYRDFNSFKSPQELLEHMQEIQSKIHYYIDEIETFMPETRS